MSKTVEIHQGMKYPFPGNLKAFQAMLFSALAFIKLTIYQYTSACFPRLQNKGLSLKHCLNLKVNRGTRITVYGIPMTHQKDTVITSLHIKVINSSFDNHLSKQFENFVQILLNFLTDFIKFAKT